ncbi:MAG TPA: S41 family peptidase [Thermoanaerobaculia bacterium]|nr:S41 family peptidase [Thermoanaerobaculia bacterium]
MRRSWRIAAITLFTLVLVLGGLYGDRLLALTTEARDTLRLYTELVNVAHERYGAKVRYSDLVYSSIDGLLRTLDPHTGFLPPEAYQGMRERQQSTYYGLGLLVGFRDGQLTVISPMEGTPGARLGIQTGDVISTIDGESTETLSLDDAVDRLKGPKGTQVKITVVRRGLDRPLEMTVTRAEIPQTTVRQSYMLTPTTGYVMITEFSRSTGREVAEAVAKLKDQGMRQLLIDLRNNGGGVLDPAIEISDQLLPEGSTVVETRGRIRDSFQSYKAEGRFDKVDVPVVVLVNEGSASASEIVAGAVQDHDRGLIVGTPSWGKGLVQTVYNLSYGAAIALTTAKYYTPSGRLIQRDYTSYYDYYTHSGAGTPEMLGKTVKEDEIFHTDLGRKVYGGGGITPDVIIENEEMAPFTQFLLSRNTFFNFAVDYHRRHPVKSVDWKPGPEVLTEFRQWVAEQSISTTQELEKEFADARLRDQVLLQIRAEVMNSVAGQEARHRVLAQADKQIQTALSQFDRAAALQAERKLLEKREERAEKREPLG